MPLTEVRTRPDHPGGVLTVLGGGFAAVVLSPALLPLLRDQLHFGCGYGQPGTEGEGAWMCGDGISFIGPGIVLGGMTVVAVMVGAMIARFVRSDRAAPAWLTVLAVLVSGWALWWTWRAAADYIWSVPVGVQGTDYWIAAVGPAAAVIVVALGAASAGLAFTGRKAAFVLAWVALAGLFVATALQPGLGISTLAAAGLIGGALWRVGTPPRAERRGHAGVESRPSQ